MRETQNIMTLALQKITQHLLDADKVLARMGETPYGVRRATLKEQREMAARLDPQQMSELIDQHGIAGVSNWLHRLNKEA